MLKRHLGDFSYHPDGNGGTTVSWAGIKRVLEELERPPYCGRMRILASLVDPGTNSPRLVPRVLRVEGVLINSKGHLGHLLPCPLNLRTYATKNPSQAERSLQSAT